MDPRERAVLVGSGAFQSLAMHHPRAALHVAALVRGAKGVPGYAWVQCLDCSADFELENSGVWALTEESEENLSGSMCICAHAYEYGN